MVLIITSTQTHLFISNLLLNLEIMIFDKEEYNFPVYYNYIIFISISSEVKS